MNGARKLFGGVGCCLPKVLIVQFIDAEAFDGRSVKKSCISLAHSDDGKLIRFDTSNVFYRGELEKTRLAVLRGEELAAV